MTIPRSAHGFSIAAAVTFITLFVTAGTASATEPPPATNAVELVTPSGQTFTAVPDGDRYLVDRSIDPDGFIMRPISERSGAALAQPVLPTCVLARDLPDEDIVFIDNDCTTPQRVKVLIAFGDDSACLTVQAKTTATFPYSGFVVDGDARFDGLEAC